MKHGKKVEGLVADQLMGKNIPTGIDSQIVQWVEQICKHIRIVVKEPIVKVILKPKVISKPKYGGKNEPKTDVIILTVSNRYKLSIKRDMKSYIHTSNSITDSTILFLQSSFSENLTSELRSVIEVGLHQIAKVPNFCVYNKDKGTIEDYVEYHIKGILRWVNKEKYQTIKGGIIQCYYEQITKDPNQYHKLLNERESIVQNMFKQISQHPEYYRNLLFEMLTGREKFGLDSDATADWVVSIDGMFKLENPNCEYIDRLISHQLSQPKLGRLQNVPRVGISKTDLKNLKGIELYRTFPTADLSIKI